MQKRGWILLGVLLAQGLSAGEISGRVKVSTSNAPPPVMLSPYSRNRYAPPGNLSAVSQPPVVVIYLKAHAGLGSAGGNYPVAVIDQKDLAISPRVTIVQAGTAVDFTNSDAVYHNIFSLSRTKRFNLGRYPRGERRSVTFENPGTVEIFCDIHSDMNAVVLVVPNTYYAIADQDGSYSIKSVPPGTYTLTAWRENQAEQTRQVVITSGDDHIVLDFDL